jgi:hypothetical protein
VLSLLLALSLVAGGDGDARVHPIPAASGTSATSAAGVAAGIPSTTGAGRMSRTTMRTARLGPDAPAVGACYDLTYREATQPTSDAAPVRCSRPHTTQTIHVGRLDTVVDGHLLAVDSSRAQQQVTTTCPRRLARHLGGSSEERALSRLEVVWFSPTLDQSDEGATWFRCDVVLVGAREVLDPLPRPPRLQGVLDGGRAPEKKLGLCGTTAPGREGFERVVCSRRHSWRAVSTIELAGARAYPGRAAVRRDGAATCRDRVRRVIGSPARFTYGWEWPTRRQWRAGQRFGYCWTPD